MKSYFDTLKDIVAFVRNESEDVVSELLMMGFSPSQLVHDFSFKKEEVMASEVYVQLDEGMRSELEETELPFVLDGFISFDAAFIWRFEMNKEDFLVFKASDLYQKVFEYYKNELIEPETEVLNEVFDKFENDILNEFQKTGIGKKLFSLDDKIKNAQAQVVETTVEDAPVREER